MLVTTGLAIGDAGRARRRSSQAGPQGFSETLYAYLSQANNNGSAFAGYTGFVQPNAPGNVGAYGITFADLLGGADDGHSPASSRSSSSSPSPARWPARRSPRPAPARCAPTTRPSSILLIGVIVLVGALTFFPALLLGPIVQSLTTRLF